MVLRTLAIQDVFVHSRTLATVATSFGALFLAACAHSSSSEQIRSTTSHEVAPAQAEREVLAVDQTQAEAEPPRSRPRLSQTVTLGQGNSEATYAGTGTPPGQGNAQGGGTNVIINNNVTVNNQPPAYYGGYSYGARGYGVRSYGWGPTDGFSRGTGTATWGQTGWEGARGRPAAPGQTPSVGGNWAPVPSYGPAPMR
jgi:hypothetical protein